MIPRFLSLLALALFASSCSQQPATTNAEPLDVTAVQQIEGAIADDFGMPLVATCPPLPSAEIGTEFGCSATTATGQLIEFEGVVAGTDRLDISASNVVAQSAVEEVRDQLAIDLTASTGYDITVDCPMGMITMDAPQLTCTASAAEQPDTSPIGLTFTNAVTGSYRVDLTSFAIFNPHTKALELINGELTEIVGVPLVADCPLQISSTVGTEFQCSGDTPDGRTVEFAGKVDRRRHIDLQTTNFLREEIVVAFETEAANALAPQTLTDTIIECLPRPVLFNELGEIQCNMLLGNEDQARAVLITIEDFSTLEFTVSVTG